MSVTPSDPLYMRALGVLGKLANRAILDESSCWIWDGAKNDKGYGQLRVRGRTQYVHRHIYSQLVGSIPEGMYLCHKCDRPSCFNPRHIFVGSHRDNMQDASRKGRMPGGHLFGDANPMRHNPLRGERHGCAKLCDADILSIRDRPLRDTKRGGIESLNRALAAEFSVSISTIDAIRRRTKWKHVQ